MTPRGLSYLVLFLLALFVLTREKPIPDSEQARILPMDFTYDDDGTLADAV